MSVLLATLGVALLTTACVLVVAVLVWVGARFLWIAPSPGAVAGTEPTGPTALIGAHALRREMLSPGGAPVLIAVLLLAATVWVISAAWIGDGVAAGLASVDAAATAGETLGSR